ncbi:MAG: AraC family ligand binding domain-containing protein [Polyangiaceae bacterium]
MGSGRLPPGRFFGHARLRRDIGDLSLVESHHAAGSRLPRHSHDCAYFCLNFGGTYLESYGRRRRRCCTGMLVFHPPGECHEEECHSDVSSLNVELDGTWLRRVAEFVAPLDQPAEFGGDDIAAAAPAGLYGFDDPVDVEAWKKLGAEAIVKAAARKHASGKIEVFGLAYFLNVGKDPVCGLQAVFETELHSLLREVALSDHRCPLDPGCVRAGGACVACLHLGEPSCRYFNGYLDRGALSGSDGYLRPI